MMILAGHEAEEAETPDAGDGRGIVRRHRQCDHVVADLHVDLPAIVLGELRRVSGHHPLDRGQSEGVARHVGPDAIRQGRLRDER